MKLNFTHQGSGEPVILIHGLFGSLNNLAGIARTLASDFSVYSLDLRNHGASAHSKHMDYPCMAADVIEFMDSQALERAVLLGHSMGGKVAMQLALNYPHRVRKLIVADIAPVTYPRHHSVILDGLHALAEKPIESRRQADAILQAHVDEASVRSFLLTNLTKDTNNGYRLRLNLDAISRNYETLAAAPDGPPFTGPTLFLKGSDSAYIQRKHQDALLGLFPNAQIKIIANTGHWLHTEKPATFSRLVKQFINDNQTL